jgi:hypothetical protein
MNDQEMFTVTLNGEGISIPLSRARMLCPAETAAMEEAGDRVAEAAEREDPEDTAAATKDLHQRMVALLDALAEKLGPEGRDELLRITRTD